MHGASIIQLFSISSQRRDFPILRSPERLFHEDIGESVKDSLNLCFSSLLGIVKCTGDGDKIQRPLKKPLSPLGQFSPQVHASTSRKLLCRDKDRMEWKGRETERETAAEFIAHVRIPVLSVGARRRPELGFPLFPPSPH